MAWMRFSKVRTIAKQRASYWVVNGRLDLIFKHSKPTDTKEGKSWSFNMSFERPPRRFCVCLHCGTNMIVLTRSDIHNLETVYGSHSRLRWVRVVADAKGRWKIIGSNHKSLPITYEGGLGYFLMHDRAKGPPRLRVV